MRIPSLKLVSSNHLQRKNQHHPSPWNTVLFSNHPFLTTAEETKSPKKRLVLVATPRVSRDAPGIVATNVVEVQKPVETWLLVGCWRGWIGVGKEQGPKECIGGVTLTLYLQMGNWGYNDITYSL